MMLSMLLALHNVIISNQMENTSQQTLKNKYEKQISCHNTLIATQTCELIRLPLAGIRAHSNVYTLTQKKTSRKLSSTSRMPPGNVFSIQQHRSLNCEMLPVLCRLTERSEPEVTELGLTNSTGQWPQSVEQIHSKQSRYT